MMTVPEGLVQNYFPDSVNPIAQTPMLQPDSEQDLIFNKPLSINQKPDRN